MTAKRAHTVLIGASLLSLSLSVAACGSDADSPEKGAALTVLVGANTSFPDQQRQWFDHVSAKFKEQTGGSVTFETFASANDELMRIQTSVLSGQGPDVYALGTTFTPTAYSTKAFGGGRQVTTPQWTLSGFGDEIDPEPAVQLAVLAALGARYVEVRSAWDINVVDMPAGELDLFADALAARGMAVSAIASPIGKVDIAGDPDAELARLARAVAAAFGRAARAFAALTSSIGVRVC